MENQRSNDNHSLINFFLKDIEKISSKKAEEEIKKKTQKKTSYNEIKNELKCVDLNLKKGFKKFLFWFKIISIVIIGMITFICILVIYYIAILQFLGKNLSTAYNISWLIPQTISFIFGGIIGYLISKLFK